MVSDFSQAFFFSAIGDKTGYKRTLTPRLWILRTWQTAARQLFALFVFKERQICLFLFTTGA
jgi:hypothetical protein